MPCQDSTLEHDLLVEFDVFQASLGHNHQAWVSFPLLNQQYPMSTPALNRDASQQVLF